MTANRVIILFFLFAISTSLRAQTTGNPSCFQGGLAINFLYKQSKDYSGPPGSYAVYDVQDLKPLPGFSLAFIKQFRISDVSFFRLGGALSYHANSAVINYTNTVQDTLVDKRENVSARFKNLYVQLPLEFGFNSGEKKIFSVFGGLKISYRISNQSKWEYMQTTYDYNFSIDPPFLIDSVGPAQQNETLSTNTSDIAIEIGFAQTLSEHLVIEEHIDASLITMMNFGDVALAPTLHQITGEIVIGWKLNKNSSE